MKKEQKPKEVESLKALADSYQVLGVLNMHKLPAASLQKIRDSLRGKAVIRVSKKGLIKRALKNTGKAGMTESLSGETGLLLSNENPFRLFQILKESRTPAAAKIGDTAPHDVTIQKGPTSIPPGPAISTFQKVGLKTSVQQGKITVMSDKVIAKAGEKITADMVNILNLLKMEPMEIGLDMVAAWENKFIYDKRTLNIDIGEYQAHIETAIMDCINLAVNAGYPTKENIELMIQKVFNEAKSLCMEASIIEKDFIEDILAKAIREAMALPQPQQ